MNKSVMIKKAEKDILGSFLDILLKHKTKKCALETSLSEIVTIDWLPIEPKGGIFLVSKNNSNQLNLFTTTANFSPELLTLCHKVDFGYCICGRAAASKKIIFVNCVNELHDTTFDGISAHGHYSVPFFNSSNDLLGVLVLYVPHGHVSNAEEVSFLEFVAKGLGSICQRFDQEEKVKESDKLLQHKSKLALIGEMASNVGHEINNPLAVSIGNVNILRKFLNKGFVDIQKILNMLTRIEEANERMRE